MVAKSTKKRTDLQRNRTKLRKLKKVSKSCGPRAAEKYLAIPGVKLALSSFPLEVKALSVKYEFETK